MKDERKDTKWHKTPSETNIEITAEDIYNYYFDLFKQKKLIGWLTSVEEYFNCLVKGMVSYIFLLVSSVAFCQL